MADARALLRQQRAARRIEHPYASYSDSGKLLCRLCHEVIKSESLWDGHLRGTGHTTKLQAAQARPQPQVSAGFADGSNKRKHDDVEDEEVADSGSAEAELSEEAVRKKRSKPDMVISSSSSSSGIAALTAASDKERMQTQTPPGLNRRASATPSQGVELSIPSRPATPLMGEGSANSTPRIGAMGRSPLIGSNNTSTPMSTGTASASGKLDISTEVISRPSSAAAPPTSVPAVAAATSGDAVDEDEWAAFEAEIAAAEVPQAGTANIYADATISAPALTAEQVAAKSEEEENTRRKLLRDAEIADEKEDATRALEEEFDEMEELEGRVRRLKERREALRKGSMSGAARADVEGLKATASAGKENAAVATNGQAGGDEDEEDDDEDEDDWDGFRFRA